MSLTQEPQAIAGVSPGPSLVRRFRFPVSLLAVVGAIFAIPWVCIAFDYEPEGAMMAFMMTQWHAPALGALVLILWWVFFSPFRWLTRLGVMAAFAAACVGFYFSIREVELTKGRVGLVPRFHFVWEPNPRDQLTAYLKGNQGDGLGPIDATIGLEDFPRYRGVKGDGDVRFARLEADWKKHPPKLLWRHPSPGGYSGIAVAGNIAVTLEQRDEGETVACYDRDTGKQRWAYSYDANYEDKLKMGNGPRSTPAIHDHHIYTIGATGELLCLTTLGNQRWRTNVLTDGKAVNVKWGLTGSPLLVDDLVIAHAGINPDNPANSALIAYEQATGKIRWRAGNNRAGYSSPHLANLHGKPQILLFDAAGLNAYDPKTGKELWTFPWVTMEDMNSIQPLVVGNDRVFISSEATEGCVMLRVKAPDNDQGAWSVEPVWKNKKLGTRYANPVMDGKRIFALHALQGVLKCLDVETGKELWRGEREGPGQLLLADGVLLVVNGDTGDTALFDANASECVELGRYQTFEKQDKTWNTQALAGDQLFVRNQSFIACLKLPRR